MATRSRGVRVRRLGVRDAPRLAGPLSGLFDLPPDPSATRGYLADRRNLFLLASFGGTPAGFLRGTTLRQVRTRRPQFFLYELGVTPPLRRRGVGRALIRHLLAFCRARRYDEVFVLTEPANRAAVGLYRATGGRPETPADRMYVYRLHPRGRH